MEHSSRKKLAAAAVQLLAAYPVSQVMAVVAQELVRQRWTREADTVLQDMVAELWRQEGQALVTLKSAQVLPVRLVSAIKRLLRQRLPARTVSVTALVDPTLRGGIVAITPAGVLDVSVAGQLRRLRQL